jgi:hypothetical protein
MPRIVRLRNTRANRQREEACRRLLSQQLRPFHLLIRKHRDNKIMNHLGHLHRVESVCDCGHPMELTQFFEETFLFKCYNCRRNCIWNMRTNFTSIELTILNRQLLKDGSWITVRNNVIEFHSFTTCSKIVQLSLLEGQYIRKIHDISNGLLCELSYPNASCVVDRITDEQYILNNIGHCSNSFVNGNYFGALYYQNNLIMMKILQLPSEEVRELIICESKDQVELLWTSILFPSANEILINVIRRNKNTNFYIVNFQDNVLTSTYLPQFDKMGRVVKLSNDQFALFPIFYYDRLQKDKNCSVLIWNREINSVTSMPYEQYRKTTNLLPQEFKKLFGTGLSFCRFFTQEDKDKCLKNIETVLPTCIVPDLYSLISEYV